MRFAVPLPPLLRRPFSACITTPGGHQGCMSFPSTGLPSATRLEGPLPPASPVDRELTPNPQEITETAGEPEPRASHGSAVWRFLQDMASRILETGGPSPDQPETDRTGPEVGRKEPTTGNRTLKRGHPHTRRAHGSPHGYSRAPRYSVGRAKKPDDLDLPHTSQEKCGPRGVRKVSPIPSGEG